MILNNKEISGLRSMLETTRKELKEVKKMNHDNAMLVEKQKVRILELEQIIKRKDRRIKVLLNKKYAKKSS